MEIGPEQTAVELFDVLARAGAPLVVETLAGLAGGTIKPQPQNHEFATFAPLLDREDGRMDFAARTATELHNRWRGFQPWPGAFTALDGKKLIVHRMKVADAGGLKAPGLVAPGRILVENHRLFAACADEYLAGIPRSAARRQEAPGHGGISAGNPLAADARLG